MKAISQRRHEALLTTLRQLAALLETISEERHATTASKAEVAVINEGRQQLKKVYSDYERLLAELEKTITSYDKLYHHLKVGILGGHLRVLRKEATQPNATDYSLLLESLHLTRAM